jgi:hypothetical protein
MVRIGKAVLVISFFGLFAWAGDVWKDKPYQQWDRKEVLKVLNDSPWSKTISVSVTSRAVAAPSAGGEARGGYGPMGGGGGASSSELGREQPTPMTSADQGESLVAEYHVRWLSSRAIREGLVRLQILEGKMGEADAERYLAQPVSDYQLLLFGRDMSPFEAVEESSLKEKSYLEMKRSKQKLAPANVQIQRTPDGKRIVAVLFSFPKKTSSGEATVASEEKSVEFVCSAGPFRLRTSFEPAKMVDRQGSDL